LPKTFIHLWNFSRTSFFASVSDFAASFSSFKISHFSATLFTSIVFAFFYFFVFVFSLPFLLVSFLLLSLPLPLFVFATLVFPALVSTASYTLLNTLSSSSLPFSSQSQDCGKLAIAFPRLLVTSVLLTHQSLSSLYALGSKY